MGGRTGWSGSGLLRPSAKVAGNARWPNWPGGTAGKVNKARLQCCGQSQLPSLQQSCACACVALSGNCAKVGGGVAPWHGMVAGIVACMVDAELTIAAAGIAPDAITGIAMPTDAHAPVAVLATRHRHSSRRSRRCSTGARGSGQVR